MAVHGVTKEMLVDDLLSQPGLGVGELARRYGYSVSWMSTLLRSDGFQEMLAARRAELGLEQVVVRAQERLEALVNEGAEVVLERVVASRDAKLSLQAMRVAGELLGMGQAKAPPAIQAQFIVNVPPKAGDAQSWVEQYTPRPAPPVELADPPGVGVSPGVELPAPAPVEEEPTYILRGEAGLG